ncbi:MAG: AAA family ATPase, partial [Marmoricola sp.]
NARVFAAGRWRGLHSVGVVDSIEAINGIGHAAVMCDPEFRGVLAAHGYTLDPETGEVAQLASYAGSFSARAAQITRNIDRYEAQWRTEHPDEEPGPTLRRAWDRRAWSQARPDKVAPVSGDELRGRWVEELHVLGFTPPPVGVEHRAVPIGRVNRDAVVDLVLSRLGVRRSSWNAADIRGEVERIISAADVVAPTPVRRELVEDLTQRAVARCVPLLARDDVPEHVRSLTSREVLDVEADLLARFAARAEHTATAARVGHVVAGRELDEAQRQVVAALGGTASLLVIEGAAGAGKTTTLAAARELLEMQDSRLVVVTPTLKAAQVAQEQLGADAFTSAWLVHQHGFRWDEDGHWSRTPVPRDALPAQARLLPGDLLLVDEAGMLDQDTARALLTIADATHARVAFVGDRHQLPAVGRGGVLDHAARWARPETCLELETVHRFTDPDYADLTLLMRTGQRPGEVFDQLHARGLITIHPTEVQRLAALTELDGTIIADTREQVATLNAAIHDQRLTTGQTRAAGAVTTAAGEQLGVGDQITTRRNDRDLGVANRDRWTVTGTDGHGGLLVRGRGVARTRPAHYVDQHVELAYATTVHGAQGETVDQAHLLIGEATGAAAAYVGMTRGRHHNTAHLVAETLEEARAQWVDVFNRDRADLGPGHAARTAAEDINRCGPRAPAQATEIDVPAPHHGPRRPPEPIPASPASGRSPGISR